MSSRKNKKTNKAATNKTTPIKEPNTSSPETATATPAKSVPEPDAQPVQLEPDSGETSTEPAAKASVVADGETQETPKPTSETPAEPVTEPETQEPASDQPETNESPTASDAETVSETPETPVVTEPVIAAATAPTTLPITPETPAVVATPVTPANPVTPPVTQLSAPPAVGPAAVLDPNAPTAGTKPDVESGIDPEVINPAGGETPTDAVTEQGDLINPAAPPSVDAQEQRAQAQRDAEYVEKRLVKEGWGKLVPPIGKACFHKGGVFAGRFGDKVDKPEELDEQHTANIHAMAIDLVGKLDTQTIASFVFDHTSVTKDMMSGALTGTAEQDVKFLISRPKDELVGYAAGLELETKGMKESQLAQMIITAHDIS